MQLIRIDQKKYGVMRKGNEYHIFQRNTEMFKTPFTLTSEDSQKKKKRLVMKRVDLRKGGNQ